MKWKPPSIVKSTPIQWHLQQAPPSMLHDHEIYMQNAQQVGLQTTIKVGLKVASEVSLNGGTILY